MSRRLAVGRFVSRAVTAAALATLAVLACLPSTRSESDDAVVERFTQLHRAVYDAYSIGADRDRLWSHLAETFAGHALTEEYVEHYSTAVQMASDAIRIDVLNVDYEDVEVVARRRPGDPFRVRATWSVGGIVHHRNHSHPRINSYRASYELAPVDGDQDELRIVETRLLAMRRIRGASDVLQGGEAGPTSASGFFSVTDLVRAGVVEKNDESSSPQEP